MFHVKHSDDIATIAGEHRIRLNEFVALLQRWNARINLISRTDEAAIWPRHILDSAQLVPLMPPNAQEIIDLGSGAGFPGLIVAVLTGVRAHLVEVDQRKAAFLREAVRVTAADARVHSVRAELLRLPPVPVVTSRALAPLPRLLALAVPLLTADGVCLFPKGPGVEAELTAAAREWHMRVERIPSSTNPGSSLLRISEIRRAG